MTSLITRHGSSQLQSATAGHLFDDWFDPIESEIRGRVRGLLEELIRSELNAAQARPHYKRRARSNADVNDTVGVAGHRHGSRTRTLMGSFGKVVISVPRARLQASDGKTSESRSQTLRAYQRRTLAVDALIASAYLAGTNTRRVRRALAALFNGAVGKDTVSRVWRKVKSDWDAWNRRSLAEQPIVRLILDGTVVCVRLDRKATSISLLVVMAVLEDGQKMLLAIKSMGADSSEAWRSVLDDLVGRGLRRPQLLIIDGAAGLDKAIAAVWNGVPVQRCTVHKHRNLLPHAPERLHDEITADYTVIIYAVTPGEIETRRKAFIRKWRLKHRVIANSIEEAGDRLFAFTRLQTSQWRSARTTNAVERLHEEFKRRIKTQTVLPTAETAAMLFCALLDSDQISMRKIDGSPSCVAARYSDPGGAAGSAAGGEHMVGEAGFIADDGGTEGGRRVRLIDATSFGTGGAREATWRVHADYDIGRSRFIGFELTGGYEAERLTRFATLPGDVNSGTESLGSSREP